MPPVLIGQRPLVASLLPADRPNPSLSTSCPLPCAFCSVQRQPRPPWGLPPGGLPPRPGLPNCEVKPEHNALPYLLFNVTKSSRWEQRLKVKSSFTNNITTNCDRLHTKGVVLGGEPLILRSWWRKFLSCPAAPRLKRTRRGQPVADPNSMNSTTLPVWLRFCPPDRVARPASGYPAGSSTCRTALLRCPQSRVAQRTQDGVFDASLQKPMHNPG